MNYYVDYFDFYLGGIGNRTFIKNRSIRFRFDILCLNPDTDKMIFTLSETLLEDSNRIITQYDDFWKKGVFKIAFSPKYKTANTYINDRLNILHSGPTMERNFEIDIYQSAITSGFLNDYLLEKLDLRGKNSYVIHRTSNADLNNRLLLKSRVNQSDNIYGQISKCLDLKKFDTLMYYLLKRADDKKQIFQREYIVNEIFLKYPELNKKREVFYNMFDQNYNDAMALSVNARRLSTINDRINGIGLANFIYQFDYNLYKNICSLKSSQIFLLVTSPSWHSFLADINGIYNYLFSIKKIDQNYNCYKYLKRFFITKTYVCKYILDIMEWVVNIMATQIPKSYWYMYCKSLELEVNNILESFFNPKYIFDIATKIFAKKELMNLLVDDIKKVEV